MGDRPYDVEGRGAVDGWLAVAGELVAVHLDVSRVVGDHFSVRCLHDRERLQALGPVLVDDERAPDDGVHFSIRGDDPETDGVEGDHGGQVVELGSQHLAGTRPVAEGGLGEQELKGAVRVVQDLLAGQPGRDDRPEVALAVDVGEGHDAPGVLGRLQQARDDAGLEITQRPSGGFPVADRLLDGCQATGELVPERGDLGNGHIQQGEQDGATVGWGLGGPSPGGDLGHRRQRVATLETGDRLLADPYCASQLFARQASKPAHLAQLASEPCPLDAGLTGLPGCGHAASISLSARYPASGTECRSARAASALHLLTAATTSVTVAPRYRPSRSYCMSAANSCGVSASNSQKSRWSTANSGCTERSAMRTTSPAAADSR